jgi:hypothetical protein
VRRDHRLLKAILLGVWRVAASSLAGTSAAEATKAAYDQARWRYELSPRYDPQTWKSQFGGIPFHPPRRSLLNSNCGSCNCSSRQKCIRRQQGCEPGANKTGIGAMSQNGSWRSGASRWIATPAALRDSAGRHHCGREQVGAGSPEVNE